MNTDFYIKCPLVFQNGFNWEACNDNVSIQDTLMIKEMLKRDGLCLFSFDSTIEHIQIINGLANDLGLKEPFISPQNKKFHHSAFNQNVNYIGSSSHRSKHSVFDRTTGQGLHVDGTFEQIGSVGTTILCCINPATQGGESTFFHATKAFELFYKESPKLATLFLLPDALRRHNYGEEQSQGSIENIGPAFAYINGKLVTRFTVDSSSDWEYGFQRIEGLKEAFLAFQQFYSIDSPYVKMVKLKQHQGVIFLNNIISHGRLSFKNDLHSPRVYCRGLFKEAVV
ncbi:TauD/TfdA family dioxygenase [Phocoenobacter skyensis]|uniref:TauD/TfdA family dioxygenase n=1 Tax=Phocoenobacter skyensis TaxID=97481 RepID=A0A1H7WPY9_9PAST|nr:TauD/TfdA family dioxygenase [Pasteurella skyensis]MDP8079001.1 TauD/TfdA family dioxygenase [Pasteurella skyensis]MDP8084951.1 TauD/TfdA family dioxygenase [Pasteurella skyensis]MDP8162783.1 TauD/TfdA family dioxygenase [Pasteurella skyensis]MDP8172630.1 TauD/TfdA family dioxygenase [Pasteurella skyensis]MDP8177656.1 TauD/TfdA family dioxygenase [Pasteurella skyensis]